MMNTVAWVTGASSGIGRATAVRLAQEGAAVVCSARREDELESVVDQIRSSGGQAAIAAADVTNLEQLQSAVQVALDQFGRLDAVVANAGINGTWAPLEDLTPEDFEKTWRVNLLGSFLTVKAALEPLKKSCGNIVFVGSVNGTRIFSNRGATGYATSKGGQLAMMQMMAVELGEHGIRVNAVCPGAIDTPINEKTTYENLDQAGPRVEFPDGRIPLTAGKSGSSDQVADLIAFLTSQRAAHITGTPIWIDGGESLLQG
jgi:NAD(P)-dependent dehydrogenase (short-subunit alcohol dehydrogenase family)